MKNKIFFIICAIFFVLLIVWQLPVWEIMERQDRSSSRKSKTIETTQNLNEIPESNDLSHLQPVKQSSKKSSDKSEIKDVIQQGFGDGAVIAKDAMEAYLKTWNPIGLSAQEVKATLGKPSEEKANSITYMFDTGAFGWNFEFVLRNGRVVELARPASE